MPRYRSPSASPVPSPAPTSPLYFPYPKRAPSRSRSRRPSPSPPRSTSRSRSPSPSRSSSSRSTSTSTKFKNATNSDTKTESAVKTSLIFLGAVGAATYAAHKFWPKGITYGDKEEWETREEKKVKKAIRDAKDGVDDDSSSDEESGGRRRDMGQGGRGGGSDGCGRERDRGGRGRDGGGRGRNPSLNGDGRARHRDVGRASDISASTGSDARDQDRRPRNGRYAVEPDVARGRSWDRQRPRDPYYEPRDPYYDEPRDRHGGKPQVRDDHEGLVAANRQDYARRGVSVGAGYLTRREVVVKETERIPGGRAKSQLRERYITSSNDRDTLDVSSTISDRRRSGAERAAEYFGSGQRYPAIEPTRSTAGTDYSTRSVYREAEDEPDVVYVRRETSVSERPYSEAVPVNAGRSRSRYREDCYGR